MKPEEFQRQLDVWVRAEIEAFKVKVRLTRT
jgi:hypothetical protein